MFFGFAYQSPHGRAEGERCGSCDQGPSWACGLNEVDLTCAGRFCGPDGTCSSKPLCPAGTYHRHHGGRTTNEEVSASPYILPGQPLRRRLRCLKAPTYL